MFYTPNLRHLAALIEIDALGSINKAAEAVYLSQSALTQGLSNMEAELGTALFDRSSTGMYATVTGRKLIQRSKRALQYFHNFEKSLKAYSRASGFRANWQIHLNASNAQLRAVIAIVEHKNISFAANSLGLAQPTVQRSARDLEKNLGQSLFVRSATGVEPTPLARSLARFASLGLSEIQAGIDAVNEIQGRMTGKLSIGALPLARTALVPASVNELIKRFPELQLSIIDGPYDELIHALLHSRIDIILGALREPSPLKEIRQQPLFEDELSVLVRADHPMLEHKTLQLADLAELDWIAPRVGTPSRHRFQNIFKHKNLPEPEHIIECSSTVATRGLLLNTDRVALLSRRQLLPEIEAGLLATLPVLLPESRRPIGLTLRKDWQATQAQQCYIDILKKITADYQ
tara:strand:+ start:23614 stop:24828 length:1215 start_codon:yes stop_codon:yes gene_type:complete